MFAELGYDVIRLRRVRYGPIRLGDLPAGEWRELDERELNALRRVKRAGDDEG
jgi:16S rRNA U516 pseudouridylate synthase RsuA-like enzyme